MSISNSFNRRAFLRNSFAAASGIAMMPSFPVTAASPARKLRIGVIGCGSRGNWLGEKMISHGGFEIVAGADYFPDRLAAFSSIFGVPESRLYSGLGGYRKLLELKDVEAVAIESPPFFHPEQAMAAVNAGKHVYLAKPVAVDVPGCLSIGESGALATRKGLVYLVDFQTRANEAYREAVRLVHEGAIGEFSFGESYYHAGNPFENRDSTQLLREDPGNPENRLRAWGLDKTLSGDIITEQNIHTLDVSSWILQRTPLAATGTCSAKTRDVGDCHDHFSVIYTFSDEIDVAFHSRQFQAGGTKPDGIYNRMFGTHGALETTYSGNIILRGKPVYRGDSKNLFATGAEANLAAFHSQVFAGEAGNPTVEPSVRSTLLTVLGREAAYSGRILSWDALMQQATRLNLDLELKA